MKRWADFTGLGQGRFQGARIRAGFFSSNQLEFFQLELQGRLQGGRIRAGSSWVFQLEPARPPEGVEAFEWYCPKCYDLVYRVEVVVKSIVEDLPPIFDAFYSDEEKRTCNSCGHLHPSREKS